MDLDRSFGLLLLLLLVFDVEGGDRGFPGKFGEGGGGGGPSLRDDGRITDAAFVRRSACFREKFSTGAVVRKEVFPVLPVPVEVEEVVLRRRNGVAVAYGVSGNCINPILT